MGLSLLYIVLIGCLEAVLIISGNNYECGLSDNPVCGPMGICNCSNMIVNCSDRGWTALPSTLPSEVMYLLLSNNEISCVPAEYFNNFTKLDTLSMDSNKIRRSFYLPNSLKYIYISQNRLQDIDNFFVHCENLKLADLTNNNLTVIPEGVFKTCSALKTLSLKLNDLRAIWNRSFVGLTSLEDLSFNGNSVGLHLYPHSISTVCKSLHTLTLRETHIEQISNRPFQCCDSLTSLDLMRSGITDLPADMFRGLPLLSLDISRNDVREIPEDLFPNLEGFVKLIMSSMKLVKLPERLLETTSVNGIMDVGSNYLTEIPSKLFSMNPKGHLMTTLLLCGNQLTTIPKGLFNNLTNLRDLYLHGNKITTLPGYMLAGTGIEFLYLFQNLIHILEEPLRGDNRSSLRQVSMQDNPIRQLTSEILDEMVDGGIINLSCERLTMPTIREGLNVTCMPPSAPLAMNVSEYAAQVFRYRGFNCTKTGIDNLQTCQSCLAGTFGGRDKGHCELCPEGGFYQDQVGQYSSDGISIKCKTCNNGTFVRESGGDSPLKCEVCPTGTNKSVWAGFRACLCLDGYYRRDRFGQCDLCSQDGAQCRNDYMTISPGYYWNWSSPLTDLDEYIRYVENLNTFSEWYGVNSTTFNGSLARSYKCSKPHRCTNNNENISGNCAEGYTGWMCTACEEKHFPIFGFCRPCPGLSMFVLELVLILIVFLILVCLFVFSYRRQDRHNRSLVDSTLALFKIVLGFYQVMGEFWESIDVVFWPQFLKSIASWLEVFQLNISSILIKPSCFNPKLKFTPYTAFIFGSLFPYLLIIGAIFVIAVVKLYFRMSAKRQSANVGDINMRLRRYQSNILSVLVLVLFVTYTSTCNVIFDLYGPTCDEYSLDEDNVHNISLLRSDYSIDCNTETHRRYEIASYCASIYIIAFPTILYILLWRHSKKIPIGNFNQDEPRQEELPKWLRFLNENYKVDFWFWEIVELVRKVSQTFVIVLFGWHSYFAIIITLTLAVVFLTLHISFRPMKDNFEYYLQLTSLWAIFCNMLISAVPVPDNFRRSFSADIVVALLVIINISVIGIAAVVTFLKMVLILCRRDCCKRKEELRLIIQAEENELTNEDEEELFHET